MRFIRLARGSASLGCAALLLLGGCQDELTPVQPQSEEVAPSHLDEPPNPLVPIDDPYPGHIEEGAIQLEMETIAEGKGLTAPNWGTFAPGQPDILYVVDQDGPLWAIDVNTGAKTLCLNTRPLLVPLGAFGPDTYDERGFLGVAFHPDFQMNGLLYTYTSEKGGREGQPNHWSVIRRWQISNPDVIEHGPLVAGQTQDDQGTGTCGAVPDPIPTLEFQQPQFNHNGGAIFFGRRTMQVAGDPMNEDPVADDRRMLYITSGDGGCADDQNLQTGFQGETCIGHGPGSEQTNPNRNGNGQRLGTPLGKLLRIPLATGLEKYGSYPVDAPFPETFIYAFGFRNPFRGSADRADLGGTGEIWLGDVGQNMIEEVDGRVKFRGNYGWHFKEGQWLFNPFFYEINFASDGFIYAFSPNNPPDMIDPVAEYDHDEGVAVVGGFVYRGQQIPELRGRYVFGDYSDGFNSANGRVMYVDENDMADPHDRTPKVFNLINNHTNVFVLGFGEDARGEIYVLANKTGIPFEETGVVMRLVRECDDDRDCRD